MLAALQSSQLSLTIFLLPPFSRHEPAVLYCRSRVHAWPAESPPLPECLVSAGFARAAPLHVQRSVSALCARMRRTLHRCADGMLAYTNASGWDVTLGSNIGTVPTRSGRFAGMLLRLTNYNTCSIWLLLMHSHMLLSGVCVFGFHCLCVGHSTVIFILLYQHMWFLVGTANT